MSSIVVMTAALTYTEEIMNEVRIYIGLNDVITKKQMFETDRYINILKNVCFAYKTPFSFAVEEGGYFHEDGTYTQETTLVLVLLDPLNHIVDEIAKDLCVFFHQESVLITENAVRSYYVNESLERNPITNQAESDLPG